MLPGHATGDALRSALGRPLRSGLAVLGTAVGVGTLIATLSIGAGARDQIARQIESLGANVLMVLPDAGRGRSEGYARPVELSVDDAAAIAAALPDVAAAAPSVQGVARLIRGARNREVRLNGTTADYFAIRDWPLARGRAFSADDEARAARVVVLGQTAAEALFGAEDPVGREIRIATAPVEVIGVLERKGESGSGRDQDDIAFIPFRSAERRFGLQLSPVRPGAASYLLVKASPEADAGAVAGRIEDLLRRRHDAPPGTAPGFRVTDPAAAMAARRASAETLGWLLAAIASITLIAGGIGIMNIMLVSVSERTREIGLRLAIGARKGQIARLFLIEAVILAVIGATFGVAAGLAGSGIVRGLTDWPILVTAEAIAGATLFAAAVGLVFGYLPARRAAALAPAEALRAP